MSLMMRVSQRTGEGHHGQVNRDYILGAPQPVEGHNNFLQHHHMSMYMSLRALEIIYWPP